MNIENCSEHVARSPCGVCIDIAFKNGIGIQFTGKRSQESSSVKFITICVDETYTSVDVIHEKCQSSIVLGSSPNCSGSSLGRQECGAKYTSVKAPDDTRAGACIFYDNQ